MSGKRFVAYLAFLLAVVWWLGCATAPAPRGGRAASNFEKGLKYSEWLYSQPIDILKGEPFSLPEIRPRRAAHTDTVTEAAAADTSVRLFAVQLGSFRHEENARRFLAQVRQTHPRWKTELRFSEGLWRVVVGFYGTHGDAENVRDILREQGFPDAWIVHFR